MGKETKQYVRVQRNERWNVNESFWRFAIGVHKGLLEAAKEAGPHLQSGGSCKQRVDDLLAAGARGEAGYFDFWRAFAKIDTDCANEPSFAEVVQVQRELRRQDVIGQILELEHVEETARRNLYCAPL